MEFTCNNVSIMKLDKQTYNILINQPNPRIAERDYLECTVLNDLFQDVYFQENCIFAGGATLSKAYGLSDRINEDIDLVCSDFTDIPDIHSRKRLQKFRRQFKEFVFDVLRPRINYIANQNQRYMILTDRDWRVLVNREDPLSSPTLHLMYKSAFHGDMGHMCIEIIPRKYTHDAIDSHFITPYGTTRLFGEIPVVSLAQTFWDKVYAITSTNAQTAPVFRPMFSRHYADVAKIEPYVNLHATQHMFADIVAHQSKYTTRDTNAQIQTTADVNLVSSPETMARLGNDFANMRPQFHKQPPQWTNIVNKLQIINNNIKSINR